MVYCSKCAYQNFCYAGIKDYCPSYTPAMIAYDDKTTNTNDNYATYYSISNSPK